MLDIDQLDLVGGEGDVFENLAIAVDTKYPIITLRRKISNLFSRQFLTGNPVNRIGLTTSSATDITVGTFPSSMHEHFADSQAMSISSVKYIPPMPGDRSATKPTIGR